MNTRALIPFLLIAAFSGLAQAEGTAEVILRSDITFQPLNPARGDASPKAGVVWGDIKKNVPSGALLEFADGFSSPPHIHNITYRAVVISGAIYNGDPNAKKMWMGPGSFWTQPAGESHITAAPNGSKGTAFLEILEGPYLVNPSDQAFDNGEKPVNITQGNVVWLDSADVTWVDQLASTSSTDGVKMAFLWGKPQDGQKNGTFLKLPAGFSGELRGNEATLRAVIVQGHIGHRLSGDASAKTLEPGSYFGSTGNTAHQIACETEEGCILYMSTEGKYKVTRS